MTKTTVYKAPDRKTGFNNGDLTRILANHHPAAEVRTITNWSRRITQLEITEPDEQPWITTGVRNYGDCATTPPEVPSTP